MRVDRRSMAIKIELPLSLSLLLSLSLTPHSPRSTLSSSLTWLVAPVHAVTVVVVDPRRREGVPGAVEAAERRRRAGRRFQCLEVVASSRRPHAPGEERRRWRRGGLGRKKDQAREDRAERAERARARSNASHFFEFFFPSLKKKTKKLNFVPFFLSLFSFSRL